MPPQSRHPRLLVDWERRGDTFWTSLSAFFAGPKPLKLLKPAPFFRDAWMKSRFPAPAMLASLLCHIALINLSIPLSRLPGPRPRLLPPRIEVTWYGPIQDLPPLVAPGPVVKPSPPSEPDRPLPPRGADAFHPRQTILSTPFRITHPRQTLIQPQAPPQPPKILPQLPNAVVWADAPRPQPPKLPISTKALAQLRPKRVQRQATADVPIPELPNDEKRVAELNIASSPMSNPQPQFPVAPSAAAPAPRRIASQNAAAPAPNIMPSPNADKAALDRLIALSTIPGENGVPIPPPPGNEAARFVISPEGAQPGMPAGAANGAPGATGNAGTAPASPGAAKGGGREALGVPGVSITGSSPGTNAPVPAPGPIRPSGTMVAVPLPAKPEPRVALTLRKRNSAPATLQRIQPGAPEEILGSKRVYTLYVNLPNLTSATGSWVLNFAEWEEDPSAPRQHDSEELVGPVPVRKVDPKYPPALMAQRVEGEVVLYALIRRDGSVDSIRVLKGVDPQLDQNAMEALARWQFLPARRSGQPIELEAVIHIPFRAAVPF